MWSRFKTLDPWLYILPIFLASAGIAGIYSITYASTDSSRLLSDLVIKQIIFAIIGVLLLFIITFIDYRSLKAWAYWIYLLSLVSIIVLAILPASSSFVIEEFGARRWFSIFGFQFQPSEIVKIGTIISLSAIFSKVHGTLRWRRLLTALVIVVVPFLIIIKQPDLGTGIILLFSSAIIFIISNLQKSQKIILSILIVLSIMAVIFAYNRVSPFSMILKDYQRQRIATFINPDTDPKHQGYNILQSVIAVGSGGLFGKGLGFGSQSQLYFLPVAHSDFIFASLAESWGFVGAIGIIIIYGLLLSRIIIAIRIAKDRFGMFLASGIFSILFFQILINIGMNIRLFPVTGIPLPLLSYGGTSMISTFFSIGIIQSIILRYKKINF